MRTTISLTAVLLLAVFLVSCSNGAADQISSESPDALVTIVSATLSAVPPTDLPVKPTPAAETPAPPVPTNTLVILPVPLYEELNWEDLGSSVLEKGSHPPTNESIACSGHSYQAPLPLENDDLMKRVNQYYSDDNMAAMGWESFSTGTGHDGYFLFFFLEDGRLMEIRMYPFQGESTITVCIFDSIVFGTVTPPAPGQ